MRDDHGLTTFAFTILLLAMLTSLAGCGGPDAPDATNVELRPAETFAWAGGQPVRFALPPEDWKRSRYQNGGTEGVDFVRAGSGGEQILVAELLFVGRHDRCVTISEVRDNLDGYTPAAFRAAVRNTRLLVREPINRREAGVSERIDGFLGQAEEAFLRDDRTIARVQLDRALQEARGLEVSVDEAIDRVLFTKERNAVYPALEVDPPEAGDVAGERALSVSFSFESDPEPFVGRRVYVVKNNRMFQLGFQGRAENLPLFERIVDSVEFPPGPCAH